MAVNVDKVTDCNARVAEVTPENNTGRSLSGNEPGGKAVLIEWHTRGTIGLWPWNSAKLEGPNNRGMVLSKQEALALAKRITEAAGQMPD